MDVPQCYVYIGLPILFILHCNLLDIILYSDKYLISYTWYVHRNTCRCSSVIKIVQSELKVKCLQVFINFAISKPYKNPFSHFLIVACIEMGWWMDGWMDGWLEGGGGGGGGE